MTEVQKHIDRISELDKDAVAELFDGAEDQADALFGIYRMAFPEWDAITQIEGWPKVSSKTWRAIANLFQKLDQNKHPDVLPGGLWMNRGFSTDDDLPDWQIHVDCDVRLDAGDHGP